MAWPAPHSSRSIRDYLMINQYLLVSCLHLGSVIGFQYTTNSYFLLISMALLAFNSLTFLNAVSMILSPGDIEIHFDDDPTRLKLVQQATAWMAMYFIYNEGYEMFVGAALTVSLITTFAVIRTWLYFYQEGDEEE